MTKTDFKYRLQKLIDAKKIKNVDLARAMGVHESRISEYLRGKPKRPQRPTVSKMADFFGCEVEWLYTGEGPMLKEQAGQVQGGYTVNQTITRRSGAPATTTPDASPSIEGRLVYHLSPLEASLIDAIRKRDKNDELAAELLVRILQK